MMISIRSTISALGLSLLVACAAPASTPPPTAPSATPPPPAASVTPPPLAPSATPLTDADAGNPMDTPDYLVTVTRVGPPRWDYSLRYAGNFVYTAPGVLPKTDFTSVVLRTTHDISQVSVQALSATIGHLPYGTPTAKLPGATITHCSPTDILIVSQDASLGWDELSLAVSGNYPDNVVYFGFGKQCGSPSSANDIGWAGPVAGP